MAKTFVRQQADKLMEIAKHEHRLKVELLNLDLHVQSSETLNKNLARQWQILGELRSVNMDQKLPILRSLANFITDRIEARNAGDA